MPETANDGKKKPSGREPAVFHRRRALLLALVLGVSFQAALSRSPSAQSSAPDVVIDFDIPGQPLAHALVAYGAATGLDIFYNAALAEGRQSSRVVGPLTSAAALEMLLRGTGYIARTTGPGAVTILPERREAVLPPETSPTARRLYESYFATIQARVSEIVCRRVDGALDRGEIFLELWLAPSGVITRAEIVDIDGNVAGDQAFALAMHGLALGAPPTRMPQPVNMVIFPESKGPRACRSAAAQRGAG